jgi:hypothetical protein
MLIRALPCAQQQSGMQVGCLGTSTRWVSAITHSLSIWLALADHSTCAYTHMHTYITHARMPVFMHIHTHARTQTHKPATHTLKCMLIPACTYVRVHAHKHTHTHTCTHLYTHTRTHTYTHMYTQEPQVQAQVRPAPIPPLPPVIVTPTPHKPAPVTALSLWT